MAIRQAATTKGYHDPRYRALIAKLAERRKAMGLSQEALGDRIGLHQQFVSRIETGERRLDAVELVDYANALGLTADALLREVEPKRP